MRSAAGAEIKSALESPKNKFIEAIGDFKYGIGIMVFA